MAVVDALRGCVQLAAHSLGQALPENLGDFMGGHAPETDFSVAFKD